MRFLARLVLGNSKSLKNFSRGTVEKQGQQQQIKFYCAHGFRGTVSHPVFRDHLFISNKKLITRWEYAKVTECYLFTYLRLSIDIHWIEAASGSVDIYG